MYADIQPPSVTLTGTETTVTLPPKKQTVLTTITPDEVTVTQTLDGVTLTQTVDGSDNSDTGGSTYQITPLVAVFIILGYSKRKKRILFFNRC